MIALQQVIKPLSRAPGVIIRTGAFKETTFLVSEYGELKYTNGITGQLSTPKRCPLAVFGHHNMNLMKRAPIKDINTRVCTDENIIFYNGHDKFLGDIFPEAKILFLNYCEKNFIYNNMSRKIFPKVEKVFSNSHPCSHGVMHRFANNPAYVGYLTPEFYQHFLHKRWWEKDTDYIREISYENYTEYISNFDLVDPTWY